MTVVLLLFLIKAAFATPSIYVVSGDAYLYTGVYEEKREPELHYKKLGEADYEGDYFFLYTDSRRPLTWIIGYGETFSTVQAIRPVIEHQPKQGDQLSLNGAGCMMEAGRGRRRADPSLLSELWEWRGTSLERRWQSN